MCVASVGRDEHVRLWDGLLGFDWIGSYFFLVACLMATNLFFGFQTKSHSRHKSLSVRSVLVLLWNCDSARPDSLSGEPRNANFLHDILQSVNEPPDISSF